MNDIGWAVKHMQQGGHVARKGWNGKGMHLYHEPPSMSEVGDQWLGYIVMYTVQGTHVPWLCSQTDLLATDWEEV